ncbi:MAG: hypothetical protein LBI33_05790 [Propionibacteriaceae bacterium]|nr:hypothetical protein [Propionibacteriaceae bacterium]
MSDPGLTDFERQVLSDYQVSDAEYAEAQGRYVGCMADQGWTVTISDNGYTISAAPGSHARETVPQSTVDSCMKGSLFYIEPIYLGLRDNPQGLSLSEQIRACFEANGVPDGVGLTSEQFDQLVADPAFVASTPRGELCVWDPLGQNGLSIAQAQAMDEAKRAPSVGGSPALNCTPPPGWVSGQPINC